MKINTINLSGITFLPSDSFEALNSGNIRINDEICVRSESRSILNGDFSVWHIKTDKHIGWIPQLNRIKIYMRKAFNDNNRSRHDRELMRYNTAKNIRNQILTDLKVNDIETKGVIENLLFKDDDSFNHEYQGKIVSVSVTI